MKEEKILDENKDIKNEEAVETASFAGNGKGLLVVKLGDPYMFDKEEVTEINLDGIFNLTARDLCDIDRQMIAMGYFGARMEVTRQYAMLVAARVNKKPWEFCEGMKARDSIRLKETVTAFFYVK